MTLPAANNRAASASEVLQLLREICLALAAERVALTNAGGRVLREPICAPPAIREGVAHLRGEDPHAPTIQQRQKL